MKSDSSDVGGRSSRRLAAAVTAESLTDAALEREICNALDPNGAVMKYGEIAGYVAGALGVNSNAIYGAAGQVLQKMKRAGRVELIKGRGAGWRWTTAAINTRNGAKP